MKFQFVKTLMLLLSILVSGCTSQKPAQMTIKFGSLPVMQALPLYVAQDLGYFTNLGLSVELTTFNTAADKDIAMASRNLDGQFADLFTPVVIKGNGQDISIVATNYSTQFDRRMFAVLTKPGSSITSALNLADVPIALSSNTVLHYVTDKLLQGQGLRPEQIKTLESKNIGLRLQMLLSGQVEAATLPEPLVSMAETKGAQVLADDFGLSGSQTVLLFDSQFIAEHPQEVKLFLKGVAQAQDFINLNPDSARISMVKHIRLPDPLKASYPVPSFPPLQAPNTADVDEAIEWLHRQGAIKKLLNYSEVVNAQFLP